MRVLVLSPHTDDAELGAGGSIIKLLEEGNEIFWIVFSTAEDSLPQNIPKDTLKKEFQDSMKTLGLDKTNYKVYNFKVRHLHRYRQEILEILVKTRNKVRPHLVIGPSLHDFHQDHQVIANEMIRAFKTTSSIISYELPWNHITFNTQLFIKLKQHHIDKKWEILQNYKSQMIERRPYFSKKFISGLAKVRGVQCNSKYAEAFEVIRWIV